MGINHVAVLGGGNAGFSLAADLTLKGLSVTLFDLPQFESVLKPVQERGGIELTGSLGQGFAKIDRVTTDIAEALEGADLIMISIPAFAHAIFASLCAPHLRSGQIVILNPGSTGGVLEFSQVLRNKNAPKDIILAETLSLSYACLKQGPAHAHILGFKTDLLIAALPASDNAALIERTSDAFPGGLVTAANVLETSLSNLNAIAHPMANLLNTGWIEATKGDFDLYGEGMSPSVAHAMDVVDHERMAILEALGLEPVSLIEWDRRVYGLEADSMYDLMHNSTVHTGYKALDSMQSRHITEDIPYGLVPMAWMARALGVATPAMNLFIDLACLLNQTDYWTDGRTLRKLGLDGMDAEQMLEFVA